MKSGVLRACFPDVPPDWSALQRTVELAKPDLKGKAVIGGDKDHSKIWVSDEGELNRYVVQCVEADHAWARTDDLEPSDVTVWLWARAIWGLLPWLRREKACEYRPIEIPDSFPLVKASALTRLDVENVKREVDCDGAPGAKGNVVNGRAGRPFLDGSGISKVCVQDW